MTASSCTDYEGVTPLNTPIGTLGITSLESSNPWTLFSKFGEDPDLFTKKSPEYHEDTPGFEKFSAATYSPTQSPVQYHRRRRA